MKPTSTLLVLALAAASSRGLTPPRRPAVAILKDVRTTQDQLADQRRQLDQLGRGLEGLDDVVARPPGPQALTGPTSGSGNPVTLLGVPMGGPDERSLRVMHAARRLSEFSGSEWTQVEAEAEGHYRRAQNEMRIRCERVLGARQERRDPKYIAEQEAEVQAYVREMRRISETYSGVCSRYWDRVLARADYQQAWGEYQALVQASPHDAGELRPATADRDRKLAEIQNWITAPIQAAGGRP